VHRKDLILNIAVAIGFFVLGIIASPPFEDYWDANIGLKMMRRQQQ
jgi:hypothetical protein